MDSKTDQFFAFTASTGERCFLWTQWEEKDGFNITLFSGVRTWQGNVSMNQLIEMAESAEVERDEFVKLAKQALAGRSNSNGDRSTFKYDLEFEVGNLKLAWKKEITEKTYFKLGVIDLKKTEDEILQDTLFSSLLEHCSDRFSSLTSRVQNLQDENFRLSDEHQKAMERLTEAAQAKAEVEERLLGSFVDVLNAKKRKIVELRQEVDRLQEQIYSDQLGRRDMDVDEQELPEPSVAPKETKKVQKSTRSKHMEEENGEDTDEEKEQHERARQANKTSAPSLDDAELILTHADNATGKGNEDMNKETADMDEDGEDALFVPKKKQRKAGHGGRVQQASSTISGTRSRKPRAAAVTESPSIDLNSPRQTRSSSGSMNLISKLT